MATVVGFVAPNVILVEYFARNGTSFGQYFGDWVGTLPATQLTVDLGICAVVFIVWSWWEGRRIRLRAWWVTIPATFLVGLCLAVPLFLLLRERTLRLRPV